MGEPISIASVPRLKLGQRVTQQLLETVRHLAPGTKLPTESELTRQLGVGRSTLREALNALAALGNLEVRHGQGIFVLAPPAADAEHQRPEAIEVALAKGVTRDLLEARLILEVALARLAAQRRTEVDLQEIEAILEAHERSLDNPLRYGSAFHVLLSETARNEVLSVLLKSFLKSLMDPGGLGSMNNWRDSRPGNSKNTGASMTPSRRATRSCRRSGCAATSTRWSCTIGRSEASKAQAGFPIEGLARIGGG
ncbi:hypothetical protein SBV1_130078 [Verrucomicrobia bacterium]|nr:hypothetical protein SBV1_130078 [Verrucomicrobiota bacterium]